MDDLVGFTVQSRLVDILGTQYRSTEEALRELVANSWDADATIVRISLPEPLTSAPIIVEDDGYGMTRNELVSDYLAIAYNRRQARGEKTPNGRTVRGYRGIGKFAGLVAAEGMTLTTVSRGSRTSIRIARSDLDNLGADLLAQRFGLQAESTQDLAEHGTSVVLSGLRQNFSFPDSTKLGRTLLREFHRLDDFRILVNGVALTGEVLEEPAEEVILTIPGGLSATGQAWVLEKTREVADPGFVIRVNGRSVGPPTFFGLETDPDVPRSLLKRVYGELNADFLLDAVTSSWDGFIENSESYQRLQDAGKQFLRDRLIGVRQSESEAPQEEFLAAFEPQLQLLPWNRRDQARRQLLRVFNRFYDESPDRQRVIAELVLNAFEENEYWTLVQRIDATPRDDLIRLADILQEWGFKEIGGISDRARQRQSVINAFEAMIGNPDTLELSGVHKALEQNSWLLGDEFELRSSNRTLSTIVRDVFDFKYSGEREASRPDLLLVGLQEKYLLIELKRPSEQIGRSAQAQAETYRDELRKHLPNSQEIKVIVLGGSLDPTLRTAELPTYLHLVTFYEVVLAARNRIDWLLANLVLDPVPDG